MKGYVNNIEEATLNNNNFREVLYTGKNSQLVLMSLQPGEEIGMEVHEHIDQFFRVEKGTGKVILDGVETEIKDGTAIVIPAGTNHNVVNTSSEQMKLYTIYSPPEHIDGTIRATKQDAIDQPEEFDGKTTE
jgi:mannose-6-phosphate isomerase-like protein (cupin superfamily)